ncbi:MAG: hypothetical protein LBT59_07095 [Clostridiales bacterium]|nr:hypothetical protein [Clostridiales bacterium]
MQGGAQQNPEALKPSGFKALLRRLCYGRGFACDFSFIHMYVRYYAKYALLISSLLMHVLLQGKSRILVLIPYERFLQIKEHMPVSSPFQRNLFKKSQAAPILIFLILPLTKYQSVNIIVPLQTTDKTGQRKEGL